MSTCFQIRTDHRIARLFIHLLVRQYVQFISYGTNYRLLFCIIGWNLTTERRHLRLICVGSGIYAGNENPYGGRVMIFTIIKLETASV